MRPPPSPDKYVADKTPVCVRPVTFSVLKVPRLVMFDWEAPVTTCAAGTVSNTFDPLTAYRADPFPVRFEALTVPVTMRLLRVPTFVIRFWFGVRTLPTKLL